MSELQTATPLESVQSAAWAGPTPAVTVVVSSHGRSELLSGLLDALDAQDHADFEVIVADNGSQDETWSMLTSRCAATGLRLCALRLSFHDGPGVPRNTCIEAARSEVIAFTDDDCLPTPGWLSAITGAFDDDVVLVQGRTIPEPGGWGGPWGRTLEVTRPSGLYETANLAARRASIIDIGGFGGERLLSGRAFGEDVVLGSVIARTGGFRFTADAVVHHRVMPGTYDDFLEERRRLIGFPLLVRRVPELRRHVIAGCFLSHKTALADFGIAGVVLAVVLAAIGPLPGLICLAATVPWLRELWEDAGGRPGRPRLVRVLQLMFADVVGLGALIRGSLRARRLLL